MKYQTREEKRREKVESYLRDELAPTDVREAFRLLANHAERLEERVDRLHDLAEYVDLCELSVVVDTMLSLGRRERREVINYAYDRVERDVAVAARSRARPRRNTLAHFEDEAEIRRVARLD